MAFKGKFSGYILLFIICIIDHGFISGAEISEDAQLSNWRYDDDYDDGYEDFWRKYFRTTDEPDFWWKRLTVEPYDERDTYVSNKQVSTAPLIVSLLVMFVVFVCAICIVFSLKQANRNTNTAVDSPSANRLSVPQQTTNIVPSSRNVRTQINTSLVSIGNSSNLNDATDKPPGYDIVVLSDLSARVSNYPEVKPSTSESPPPKYEENFVLKY